MAQLGDIRFALVTGATGFIGGVLSRRLVGAGVRVRGLMRSPKPGPWSDMVTAALGKNDIEVPTATGVDTVFHLAAKTHALSQLGQDDEAYYRVNVEGTRSLLAAAAKAGVRRFVFFSSVKAAGEGGEYCIDESSEQPALSAYGRSKRKAEQLVLEVGRREGMHCTVLRLPLVYGPSKRGNLSRMLSAVARDRFPPLPEFGNRRSLVHVEDAVDAAILAARSERASGQTYIVTDGRAYSTKEIYELMCKHLGKTVPSWYVPMWTLRAIARTGDWLGRTMGKRFVVDSDALDKLANSAWYTSHKIEAELGFLPSRTLDQALPGMIDQLITGPSKLSRRPMKRRSR